MPAKTCPVTRTVTELKHVIDAGRLQNPRSRRIAEEILQLLNDIAWGRAGEDTFPPSPLWRTNWHTTRPMRRLWKRPHICTMPSITTARCLSATSKPTTAPPAIASTWRRLPAR